jgi:NodT family efflux transporter outer membrane factor (OMF) lipoprotein
VSPLNIPNAWSQAQPVADNATLAQWWQRFDDPLLSSLVTRALLANTSIQGAQAALQQARAFRDITTAGLWPTLGSSASMQRSRNGDASSNSFRAGLDASWEMDVFGANRQALNASEASALASAASLGDVQVSISAEVALNYIALRSAQVRLLIASSNLASQTETLEITQWRLQAGLVSSLEDHQARAATAQTRAQIPTLQTTVLQTQHALALLSGQAPAALLSVLTEVQPVPQAPAELALLIPTEVLRQRSDVRAAEYQVSVAVAKLSQANAALAPSFKLGGSLGLSALTLGALTDGASVAAAVLAGMSWPVFDGGGARAQVRGQQAALLQADAAYRATLLTALTEVEDALVALRGDRLRLSALQSAAESADTAAVLARQRYGSGLVDFSVVLETQRSRLASQDGVASTQAAISSDHVRLYKALGGGWQASDNAVAPALLPASVLAPPG